MRLLAALSAVLCAVLSAAPAAAQYPARPVRLVLSTPAGGPSDTAARALAQSLAKSLGQPVIVENKPGANGAIAVQAVMGKDCESIQYTHLAPARQRESSGLTIG